MHVFASLLFLNTKKRKGTIFKALKMAGVRDCDLKKKNILKKEGI